MRRSPGLACVLLTLGTLGLASACGGTVEPGDPSGARSGDRLRLQWMRTDDGAQQLRGLFDSELDIVCSYQATSADQSELRCLPSNYTTYSYADADCTELVFEYDEASNCGALPAYVARLELDGCTSHVTALYQAGARTELDTIYYANQQGGCDGPYATASTVYAAGAEVALDTLVQGAPVDLGEDRLRRRVIEGTDGSRYPDRIYDTELDTTCWPHATDAGAGYCMPPTLYSGGVYTDDTCEESAGQYYAACAGAEPRPAYVEVYTPSVDVCEPGTVAYHAVGDQLTDGLYAFGEADECVPYESTDDDYEYYGIGAEVPAATFAALDYAARGATRLQRYTWTNSAGEPVEAYGTFHDTELDLDCFLYRDDEGVTRCVPSTDTFVRERFTDDACTEAVPLAEVYLDPCRPPPAPTIAWDVIEDACGQVRFYEIGEVFEEPTYSLIGAECTADVTDPDTLRQYRLGPAVDMSRYQAFELVTD